MIRRWGHVHSIATGLVFGLVLDKEALVIFAMGIALGAALVVAWRLVKGAARQGREIAGEASRLVTLRERKLEAEIDRKRAAAQESVARAETRLRTAREQSAELDRRYFQGARDAASGERVSSWGWSEDDERPKTLLGVELDDALPKRAS